MCKRATAKDPSVLPSWLGGPVCQTLIELRDTAHQLVRLIAVSRRGRLDRA